MRIVMNACCETGRVYWDKGEDDIENALPAGFQINYKSTKVITDADSMLRNKQGYSAFVFRKKCSQCGRPLNKVELPHEETEKCFGCVDDGTQIQGEDESDADFQERSQ